MPKCVFYMGIGSNGCFMTGTALMGGHYRMYIISGMGHLKLNLVVLLMLWTIAYNIWDTGVALQVFRDSVNLDEKM
jgi:hypothetical protein